jgi:hypothetical protein
VVPAVAAREEGDVEVGDTHFGGVWKGERVGIVGGRLSSAGRSGVWWLVCSLVEFVKQSSIDDSFQTVLRDSVQRQSFEESEFWNCGSYVR